MKRLVRDPILCGVFVDEHNHIQFNWNKDKLYRDVVFLNKPSNGFVTKDGVIIVYAYSLNPNCPSEVLSEFRKKFKHPDMTTDVRTFVENGLNVLDEFIPLSEIDVAMHIKPTDDRKPSILGEVENQLLNKPTTKCIGYRLVKETYEHVKFDVDKARKFLIDEGIQRDRIEAILDRTVTLFNELKKTNRLFEMKRFSPRPIRFAFSDYLKFDSEEEYNAYHMLQGVNVVIYDDFITSGATIKEAARYLGSINPTNTVIAFALIRQ